MKMKKIGLLSVTMLSLLLFLTGCFKGEQSLKQVDTPYENKKESPKEDKEVQKAEPTKEVVDKDEKEDDDVSGETVARQIYLIDANGMVAPQTLELPKEDSKEVATQSLEYMVKGGPISSLIPNGFKAVLPEGTEILGLNLKEDGTMIVDVSKEFKNYKEDEEIKIIEAMTHTLTQFENVEKVKLWINGHPQDEMPVNGTPIEQGYSKANGINVSSTDATGLIDAQAVTMYYPKEYNENRYYVPVTKHVQRNEEHDYLALVNELLQGPNYETNALHVFNEGTLLKSEPVLDEGILQLEFSKDILKDEKKSIIADEVIETLVRTLTAEENIEAVSISVENVKSIVNEQGESYDEPVSKHKYSPLKKL